MSRWSPSQVEVRDGPPSEVSSALVGVSMVPSDLSAGYYEGSASRRKSYGTNPLIQEISSLKNRLHDLEEDRSSVVTSTTTATMNLMANSHNKQHHADAEEQCNFLRKEIVKLEDARAKQEAEFMNTLAGMAREKQDAIAALQAQLAQSEQERRLGGNTNHGSVWASKLEEAERRHAQQIHEITQAMGEANDEAARANSALQDVKQKLTMLEKENMALNVNLEQSQDEQCILRADLTEIERERDAAMEQLGEMNDSIVELESQCSSLQKSLQDTRQQLSKQEMANTKLKLEMNEVKNNVANDPLSPRNKALPHSPSRSSRSISSPRSFVVSPRNNNGMTSPRNNKFDDGESVRKMETKVKELQGRLNEKDQTIEELTSKLDELKKFHVRKRRQHDNKRDSMMSEQSKSSPARSFVAQRRHEMEPASPPRVKKQQWPPPPNTGPTVASTPPKNKRSSTGSMRSASPRISSLMSTFERGIPSNEHVEQEAQSPNVDSAPSDLSDSQSDSIANLKEQLQHERDTVAKLKKQMETKSNGALTSPSFTKTILRESEQEIERLKQQIVVMEKNQKANLKEIESLRKQLTQSRDQSKMIRNSSGSSGGPVAKTFDKKQKSDLEDALEESKQDSLRFQRQVEMLENTKRRLTKENNELRKQMDDNNSTTDEFKSNIHLGKESGPSEMRVKLLAREKEITRLRKEVSRFESSLQESNSQMKTLKAEMGKAKPEKASDSSASKNTYELEMKQNEIDRLKMELQTSEESQALTKSKAQRLERELDRLNKKNKGDSKQSEEFSQLQKECKTLQSELDEALNKLNEQALEIDSLKAENEEQSARARSNFVSTRERKTSLDEVSRMKEELTKTQVERGELEMNYMRRVKDLETEVEAIETEAQEQINELQSKIQELESSLFEQHEAIRRLEDEKSQLCQSMSSASHSRSEDFEEIQAELLEKTAVANSQAREIISLRMKVEEYEQSTHDEKQQLILKIQELEGELQEFRSIPKGKLEDLHKIRAENTHLRDSIRDLKSERRSIQDRLDSVLADKPQSKSTQVLRDRNMALRNEVERLNKRLKKMEDKITRFVI